MTEVATEVPSGDSPPKLDAPVSGKDADRRRADESVAINFTRLMKATTSAYGVLTDPMMVGLTTAPLVLLAVVYQRLGDDPTLSNVFVALIFLPVVSAVLTTLRLGGARSALVAWLANLPFGVDNMNAILNGLGEEFEVVFRGDLPDRAEFNERLDAVHSDAFITNVFEDRKTVEVRIGVVENKYNPSRSNFARYARCQELIEKVLLPLSTRFTIENVRIK